MRTCSVAPGRAVREPSRSAGFGTWTQDHVSFGLSAAYFTAREDKENVVGGGEASWGSEVDFRAGCNMWIWIKYGSGTGKGWRYWCQGEQDIAKFEKKIILGGMDDLSTSPLLAVMVSIILVASIKEFPICASSLGFRAIGTNELN